MNIMKNTNTKILAAQVAFLVGASAGQAQAQIGTPDNNFSTIAENITTSVEDLPGLLASISYMIGLLMGILGVMKIKDHVENPTQTALKDGAVRLGAGGALFALPILFESMQNTIGVTSANVAPATLKSAQFKVLP